MAAFQVRLGESTHNSPLAHAPLVMLAERHDETVLWSPSFVPILMGGRNHDEYDNGPDAAPPDVPVKGGYR